MAFEPSPVIVVLSLFGLKSNGKEMKKKTEKRLPKSKATVMFLALFLQVSTFVCSYSSYGFDSFRPDVATNERHK